MKTFVWIIGKPGSGKSTVGQYLSRRDDIVHFSYGELLMIIQPNPGAGGYTLEDREKVNALIISGSKNYEVTVVDGNPYSQRGFGLLDQLKDAYEQIIVVQLIIDDAKALERSLVRNRVILSHDGNMQEDRINNFNTKLLPLINEYGIGHDVKDIDVSDLSIEVVGEKILSLIFK